MTVIDSIFAVALVLLAGWAGIVAYILYADWQLRRAWRAQDERREWQRKVEAMRRIHDEQIDAYRDDRGDA